MRLVSSFPLTAISETPLPEPTGVGSLPLQSSASMPVVGVADHLEQSARVVRFVDQHGFRQHRLGVFELEPLVGPSGVAEAQAVV